MQQIILFLFISLNDKNKSTPPSRKCEGFVNDFDIENRCHKNRFDQKKISTKKNFFLFQNDFKMILKWFWRSKKIFDFFFRFLWVIENSWLRWFFDIFFDFDKEKWENHLRQKFSITHKNRKKNRKFFLTPKMVETKYYTYFKQKKKKIFFDFWSNEIFLIDQKSIKKIPYQINTNFGKYLKGGVDLFLSLTDFEINLDNCAPSPIMCYVTPTVARRWCWWQVII